MILKTKGIILRSLKYSETSIICDIYTQEKGLQSYIISGVRKKNAKTNASLLQVMSIVEIVAYYKNGQQLHRITEIKPEVIYQTIPFDVVKGAVGLFMTELVQKTVKEQEANETLFEFLYEAFKGLDEAQNSIANYHIGFMAQLSQYLGFMIDDNHSSITPYFDIKAGQFTRQRIVGLDGLDTELSEVLFDFCQLPLLDNYKVKINRMDRRLLLERLIRYYQYHSENFTTLNSFAVLQEIF